MRLILTGLALALVAVLGGSFVSANAASLPDPAKLCALIFEANGHNTKWRQSESGDREWWCDGEAHIFPPFQQAQQNDDAVWMIDYQASGRTKTRATQFYLKLQMYSSMLNNDRITAAILSRFSTIFAASNAGSVPDDLVQAIKQVRTTTVSTTLGTVETRFTPGSHAGDYIGAIFEVQLVAPSS